MCVRDNGDTHTHTHTLICWFTPQMPTAARAESQEPGIQPHFPLGVAGSQSVELEPGRVPRLSEVGLRVLPGSVTARPNTPTCRVPYVPGF